MAKKLPKKLGRPPIMGDSKMLTIRVPIEDIERWRIVAGDGKLSEWIRAACNASVQRVERRGRKG